jgi:hypothetical protein
MKVSLTDLMGRKFVEGTSSLIFLTFCEQGKGFASSENGLYVLLLVPKGIISTI